MVLESENSAYLRQINKIFEKLVGSLPARWNGLGTNKVGQNRNRTSGIKMIQCKWTFRQVFDCRHTRAAHIVEILLLKFEKKEKVLFYRCAVKASGKKESLPPSRRTTPFANSVKFKKKKVSFSPVYFG